MAKCINCNYTLVLLEHRRKYKCAKCGKLFPQGEIENKEFVKWNKERRAEEKRKLKNELHKEYIKKNKEKFKKTQKKWTDKNRKKLNEYQREYYKKNSEKIKAQQREKHEKNKDTINEKRRGASEQVKKQQNEKRNARRHVNIENTRLNSRIEYYRQKQKALTLTQLEFAYERALNNQIHKMLPTSILS